MFNTEENENLDKDNFQEKLNGFFKKAAEEEETEVDDEVEEIEEVDEAEEESNVEQEEVEVSEEEVDEVVPEKTTGHKTSKEQSAIIALKRELKEARELNRIAAAKEQEKETAKQKDDLVKKYVSEGYDEDTAERNAVQDLKISQVEKRLEIAEFKAENAALFQRYPNAITEIDKIMRDSKFTGLSPEVLCKAMYQEQSNPSQERANAAVTGNLKSKTANNSVSNASRAASSSVTKALTPLEKQKKAEYEEAFNHVVTDKEFRELHARHPF